MIPNSEENNGNQNGSSSTVGPTEFNVVLTVVKIVIVAIFLLPLAEYSIRTRNNDNLTEMDQSKSVTIDILNESQEVHYETTTENLGIKKNIEAAEKGVESCPRSYVLVTLEEILNELFVKNEFCTPDDFYNINKHKIPKSVVKNFRKESNKSTKEAKVPAIVNYAMGIILMVSVGAALVELYKAKRHPAKKDGKHSLSRKCSLADLTVMKHHRKEMVRRESLMEVPEENLYSKLDNRPTPLHRQCSFPAGPSSLPTMSTTNRRLSTTSRRFSMQTTTRYVPVVDGRPAAVLEGRRHSIISDGRQPLIMMESSRRISLDNKGMIIDRVDDSPERRHHGHSRRVHRH